MVYSTKWLSSPDDRTLKVDATCSSSIDLRQISPSALFSPVLDFAALGAHGGLSGPSFPPSTSNVRVLDQQQLGARKVLWMLDLQNTAPQCLDRLAGALAYFDHAVAALEHVEITAPPKLLTSRDRAPDGYFPALPFAFEDDRQIFARGFSVEVDFGRAVPEAIRDRVEVEAFGSWFCAASAGCFCDDAFPPNVSKIYLGEHVYWDDRMELTLDEAALSEPAASGSLINVFNWAHHHITSIHRVSLYE